MNFSVLTHLHLLRERIYLLRGLCCVYRITHLIVVAAEWVLTDFTKTFENVNPSEVRAVLNIERQVSDFPEITELSDVALGHSKL